MASLFPIASISDLGQRGRVDPPPPTVAWAGAEYGEDALRALHGALDPLLVALTYAGLDPREAVLATADVPDEALVLGLSPREGVVVVAPPEATEPAFTAQTGLPMPAAAYGVAVPVAARAGVAAVDLDAALAGYLQPPEAPTHLVLELPGAATPAELAARLGEAAVAAVPLVVDALVERWATEDTAGTGLLALVQPDPYWIVGEDDVEAEAFRRLARAVVAPVFLDEGTLRQFLEEETTPRVVGTAGPPSVRDRLDLAGVPDETLSEATATPPRETSRAWNDAARDRFQEATPDAPVPFRPRDHRRLTYTELVLDALNEEVIRHMLLEVQTQAWTLTLNAGLPADAVVEADVSGQHVTLRNAGDRFTTDDPCDMVALLQQVVVAYGEANEGDIERLRQAGEADGCLPAGAPVPAIPAADVPGAPTAGLPPDADSAEAQGAPGVTRFATLDARAVPEPDPPPTDHPPGQPDLAHGGERAQYPVLGAVEVELATGRFTFESLDMWLATAALPLEFVRSYRSGSLHLGPLGWGWDHNHNRYLRVLDDGRVTRWTGALREELFTPAGGGFEPPQGVFALLERDPGPDEAFTITALGGLRERFARPAGWPRPDRIPLTSVVDRFGNQLRYEYDAAGRLARVADDDDRAFELGYDGSGLLVAVRDQTGRAVRFDYDGPRQQLRSVIRPETPDGGPSRAYRYEPATRPPSRRNDIVAVEDGVGRVLLTNVYDDDPASWAQGRVVEQRLGDDGFFIGYRQLQYVPPDAANVDLPALRVEVTDPVGALQTSTFNHRGDLLDHRVRMVTDGSGRVSAHGLGYDGPGNLVRITWPDGREERRAFLAEDADPRRRGLMVERELFPAPDVPAESRIVWQGEYEATFGLLRSETAESGARIAYEYDAPGALVAVEPPSVRLDDGTLQRARVTFESNARGQVTAQNSPGGVRTELMYGPSGDGRGLLVGVRRDVGGLAIQETYRRDAIGNVVEMVDGTGASQTAQYDAAHRLAAMAAPAVDGRSTPVRVGRDRDGRVLTVERPKGAFGGATSGEAGIVDAIERDVLGRPTRITLGANVEQPLAVAARAMDFRGFPSEATLPDGSVVTLRVDESLAIHHAHAEGVDGAVVERRWDLDTSGRPTADTAETSDLATAASYDEFGRPSRVDDAAGTSTSYVWGVDDLVASEIVEGDPGDGGRRVLSRTDFSYDERGRLVAVTEHAFADDPDAARLVTTRYVHDADDNVVREVGPAGEAYVYEYDGLGRMVAKTDPNGNVTRLTWDGAGRLVALATITVEGGAPVERTWALERDERGRVRASVDPDGVRVEMVYDDRDLAVELREPGGVVRRREYGMVGELLAETVDADGLASTIRWEYEARQQPVRCVDPSGEETVYGYDGLGRLVRVDQPGGLTIQKELGPDGRVVRESRPGGTTIAYTYDGAGRLAELAPTGGEGGHVPPVRYSYDGLGRLVAAEAGDATVERAFDSLGRLVLEASGGVVLRASYDDAGARMTRQWPDGREEVVSLDDSGFPVRVERTRQGALGSGPPLLATLTTAGDRRLDGARLLDAVDVDVRYDALGRPAGLDHVAGGAQLEAIEVRYDERGRRRVERSAGADRLQVRTFDTIDRLVGVNEVTPAPPPTATPGDRAAQDADIAAAEAATAVPTRTEGFVYGPTDVRRVARASGEPDVDYTYIAGHRLAQAGDETFSWHADHIRAGDGAHRYVADQLGRVSEIQDLAGNLLARLTYDPLGRPASASSPWLGTRSWHYLGEDMLEERRDGVATRQFTPDPLGGGPLAYHEPGATRLALYDLGRNLVAVASEAGAVLERYRYRAFGAPSIHAPDGGDRAASAIGCLPEFGGMAVLEETGLYVARRRLMDPRHGVFLSTDPRGASDGPNLFGYARQDPVDLIDPQGEFAFLALLAVVVIGAAMAGALDAIRQGIQMAEDPIRRQQGFSWRELGLSMGIGAVMAPLLVVEPQLAIVFGALGVLNGVGEFAQGNYATGTFDIVTSLAPFGIRGVREPVIGEGTFIGKWRGLGPAKFPGVGERLARFDAINRSLVNFRPAPFGRQVGPGIARPVGATEGGHAGVVIEDAPGRLTLFHKNARHSDVPGKLEAAWASESPLPETYWQHPDRPPWSYSTIRVPRSTAYAMSKYAMARQRAAEVFIFYQKSCSNFAADVFGVGGFRGLAPVGRSGASGLWQSWQGFASAFNNARSMTYSAGFWANARLSTSPVRADEPSGPRSAGRRW